MRIMVELSDKLFNRDAEKVVELTEKIYQDGQDIKLFTKQYLNYVVNVIKYKLTNKKELTNLPMSILAELDKIDYNSTFYNLLMDNLVKLNESIKWETNPKILLQATLLTFIRN